MEKISLATKSNIWIKKVTLNEDRKEFTIAYVPEIVKRNPNFFGGYEYITCTGGFELFFTMFGLYFNSDTADTGCNLFENGTACIMVYYNEERFAIANLELSEFFVLSRNKVYCKNDFIELIKKHKRKELNSIIEGCNNKISETLKELSDLDNSTLDLN